MPRLSSLRFLWSTACPGIVFSLLLSAGAAVSQVKGQTPPPSSDYVDVNASQYGGSSLNGAAMTNVASGLKRSDVSSAVRLQSLLYPDVVSVIRVNFSKIDYVGLNDFVGEIVDKGVGAVQSNNDYLVKLRDYQKSEVKKSVRGLLSTLQNIVSQRLYRNKIDEIYFLWYSDETNILAVSTDGLSEADQKTALDAIVETLDPISVFNRYGFIVAVLSHSEAVQADVAEIQARYAVKAQEARFNAGASGYGSSDNSDYSRSSSYSNPSGYSDSGNVEASAAQAAGMPLELFSEYTAEIEKARSTAKKESRQKVLPFVRRRFTNPATAENAAKFGDPLKQTDGAAFVFISEGGKFLSDLLNSTKTPNAFAANAGIAAPFSASDSESDASSLFFDPKVIADLPFMKSVQTISVAVSLVGSPRVVALATFDTPETAKTCADALAAALILAKSSTAQELSDALVEQNIDADLTPIVDAMFTGMKPQTVDAKVAVVLDFDVFKQNALLLIPLLGGVEAKSAQEMESETIDWNSGAPEEAQPTLQENEEEAPEEDPFGDVDEEQETATPADATETKEATPEETPEEDPFGDVDEDPFA